MRRVSSGACLLAVVCLASGRAFGQCDITRFHGSAAEQVARSVDVHGNRMVVSEGDIVRVFGWNGASWAPESVISLPYEVRMVAVYGNVIAVGTLDVPGEPQTYIYRLGGSVWQLEDAFERGNHTPLITGGGRTLDIHDNLLVVGDQHAEHVWAYRYVGSQWIEEFDFYSDWTGSLFGGAVAVDQDRIVIGAPMALNDGRVWVYRYDGGTWVYEAHLGQGADDHFDGRFVDISGPVLIVGLDGRVRVYRYGNCGALGPWCEEVTFGSVVSAVISNGTLVTFGEDFSNIAIRREDYAFWGITELFPVPDVTGDEWHHVSLAIGAHAIVAGNPYDDVAGQDSGSVVAFTRSATYVRGSHAGFENGTCRYPFNTLGEGLAAAGGGLLVISAGTYAGAPATMAAPVLITASGGVVRMQR